MAAYAEFEGDDTDEYVHHLRDAATRDREAELWVATPDDSEEILGTVTVCPPGSPWREVAREGEGEFRMLAVAPAARGAGVGAALLDLVVEHFRREGASRVVMSTLPRMRCGPAHLRAGRLHPAARARLVARRGHRPDRLRPGAGAAMSEPVTATSSFTVGDAETAAAVGSGSLPVLGTPYLLAWCEAATCASVEPALGAGETSVGTRVELEHVRASVVGATLEVTATPVFATGGSTGSAWSPARPTAAAVVGTGEVTRVVVDAERFLARL